MVIFHSSWDRSSISDHSSRLYKRQAFFPRKSGVLLGDLATNHAAWPEHRRRRMEPCVHQSIDLRPHLSGFHPLFQMSSWKATLKVGGNLQRHWSDLPSLKLRTQAKLFCRPNYNPPTLLCQRGKERIHHRHHARILSIMTMAF